MEGEEVVKVESAQPAPAPAPAPVPELAADGALAEAVAVPPPKEEQLVEPAVPEAVEANGALEEVVAPSGPTDEDVREALKRLLGESDLSVVTEKMLRKSLEEQFGVPLADRKALVRAEVNAYLESQAPADVQDEGDAQDEEEDGDDGNEDAGHATGRPRARSGRKRAAGSGSAGVDDGSGPLLSPELAALVGATHLKRTEVVKRIWEYIKANGLQDPKNKRNILLDDRMRTVFVPPVNMFSMNKQLSRHIYTSDVVGVGGGGSSGRRSAKRSSDNDSDDDDDSDDDGRPRAPARKRAKSGSAPGGGGGGGFTKPVPLSEELASVTGEAAMSRGAVMKWLYGYVRANNLNDPSDKRYVLSDSTLKELTGEERFLAFGAAKLLNRHFIKAT